MEAYQEVSLPHLVEPPLLGLGANSGEDIDDEVLVPVHLHDEVIALDGLEIHQDQEDLLLQLDEEDGILLGGEGHAIIPKGAEGIDEGLRKRGIGRDDDDDALAHEPRDGLVGALDPGHLEGEGELGALAHFRDDLEPGVHQLQKTLADGEPETGARVTPREGALRERRRNKKKKSKENKEEKKRKRKKEMC